MSDVKTCKSVKGSLKACTVRNTNSIVNLQLSLDHEIVPIPTFGTLRVPTLELSEATIREKSFTGAFLL